VSLPPEVSDLETVQAGSEGRSARELGAWLSEGPVSVVALSGGVDSAVVAALAFRAAPDRVWAVTLTGPAMGDAELARARSVVRSIGIRHALIPVDPLAVEGYRTNPSNRCYFCRTTEARALQEFGASVGAGRYLDGVHLDDLTDDRPGLRALAEAGFEHPLVWARWGKAAVRRAARDLGLPNWDAPSDSCLASRVPHGTPIDAGLLRRIAAAEEELRQRGYRRVRVRVEGPGARVEVDTEELPRLLEAGESRAVTAQLNQHGFATVTMDPKGYKRRANA
jgi:uncharacterized protein